MVLVTRTCRCGRVSVPPVGMSRHGRELTVVPPLIRTSVLAGVAVCSRSLTNKRDPVVSVEALGTK